MEWQSRAGARLRDDPYFTHICSMHVSARKTKSAARRAATTANTTKAARPSRAARATSVPPASAARSPLAPGLVPMPGNFPVEQGGYEPDLVAAVSRVLGLLAIPGKSGEESAIAAAVKQELLAAGADPAAIHFDKTDQHSPHGGACGNLIFKLAGTHKSPRRMLVAHLDTVPICVGTRPAREGHIIRSANPATGLGADNRAGVAVLLTAAVEILTRRLPHPPLTFLWTVQEEVGLYGARFADLKLLSQPKLAFNWDGGPPARLTIGATGAYRLEITVTGLASHAGVAPEAGVSAIAIASLAIADLTRNGWHGLVVKGRKRGTTNVGVIHGGEATNVVCDCVRIRAEARSHDPVFRERLVREITRAFNNAARELTSATGQRGRVAVESRLDYESFLLVEESPPVQAAAYAIAGLGLTPVGHVGNGGLDANWLSARGIPTVTLGCGQRQIHTTGETLDLEDFETACRLALRLATVSEE
ncbi:MAG: M20/M25/M40 family metallo-hydrolase [Pirellulales bacterium]|nr:M20/M25/M40 family metallo-hydrolase [Pirellulales bacterium]